eukprot:gene9924-biopygen1269
MKTECSMTMEYGDGASLPDFFLCHLTRGFARDARSAIAAAQVVAHALAGYDLDAARKGMDGGAAGQLPTELQQAYCSLISNLEKYKPYSSKSPKSDPSAPAVGETLAPGRPGRPGRPQWPARGLIRSGCGLPLSGRGQLRNGCGVPSTQRMLRRVSGRINYRRAAEAKVSMVCDVPAEGQAFLLVSVLELGRAAGEGTDAESGDPRSSHRSFASSQFVSSQGSSAASLPLTPRSSPAGAPKPELTDETDCPSPRSGSGSTRPTSAPRREGSGSISLREGSSPRLRKEGSRPLRKEGSLPLSEQNRAFARISLPERQHGLAACAPPP